MHDVANTMRHSFYYLRIGSIVLCVTSGALLCALWLRSYYWIDSLDKGTSIYNRSDFRLASVWGRATLELTFHSADDDAEIEYNCVPTDPNVRYLEFWRVLFRINKFPTGCLFSVPYWLLIPLVAALGVTVPRLGYRFSLRTLLIATTVVAAVLGAFAWLR